MTRDEKDLLFDTRHRRNLGARDAVRRNSRLVEPKRWIETQERYGRAKKDERRSIAGGEQKDVDGEPKPALGGGVIAVGTRQLGDAQREILRPRVQLGVTGAGGRIHRWTGLPRLLPAVESS